MHIELKINREVKRVDIDPGDTSLTVLRRHLNLTGTKENCNQGECGACTILLNGEAVNACLILAASVDNAEITTIEGMSRDGNPILFSRPLSPKTLRSAGSARPA